jgi:5-methylthioadenosine/S-adenosylhomocysteine deaminase
MPARRLSAEWVYPVTAPPIPWGAILVGEDGRIVAVGRDAEVPSPPGVPAERFPGSALMPGLVNAHTHLELTGFAGDVDESEFDAWIRSVRSLKERRSAEDFRVAAKEGVQQCFAAGVTTVAETGDSGAVVEALDELGGRGVVFQEVFGPHPDHPPGGHARDIRLGSPSHRRLASRTLHGQRFALPCRGRVRKQ